MMDPHVALRGQKYQESSNLCNAGYTDPHISTLWISWTELLRDMAGEPWCSAVCNVLPWTKAAPVGCVLWYTRYPELPAGFLTTACASLFRNNSWPFHNSLNPFLPCYHTERLVASKHANFTYFTLNKDKIRKGIW